MRFFHLLIQKHLFITEFQILIFLIVVLTIVLKYTIISPVITINLFSPLNDLDLTVSTDFEDLAIIASDVFEVMEHDRLLAIDGFAELCLLRSFTNFSAITTSTLR